MIENRVFIIAILATLILIIIQYLFMYTKLKIGRAIEKQKEQSQKESLRPQMEVQKEEIPPKGPIASPEETKEMEKEKKTWFDSLVEGKHEGAIEILEEEKKSASGGEKLDKSVDMAFVNYFWDKKEIAFNILIDLIHQHPEHTNAYYRLARFYKWSHMIEEAINILNKGISTVEEKERTRLVLLLSSVYRDTKDKAKIEQTITRLNSLTNKTVDVFLELARLHDSLEKNGEAIFNYREALKVGPTNVKNLSEFAQYLYDKDRKIESLKEYKKIISLDPKNYDAYGMSGNIYLGLELNNKALEMYEKAHKFHPEGAWIIANIGNLYKNRGFYDKAKEYLEKALAIDPEDDYAHGRLSSTLKLIEKEIDKEKKILQKRGEEEKKVESET